MSKYISANLNSFVFFFFFYSAHVCAFKIVWYAMLALQNASVSLHVVHKPNSFWKFKNNREPNSLEFHDVRCKY